MQKRSKRILAGAIGIFCALMIAFLGMRLAKTDGRKLLFSISDAENGSLWKEVFFAPFSVEPPKEMLSFLDYLPKDSVGSPESAIGVMIDNAAPARAGHIGLEKASIIFEATAEGGVTRFLAIFSSWQDIETIGPVRSARPYFLNWFRPFHGIFVHAGGSDEVMSDLSIQEDVFDLNHHSAEDPSFWRDPERYQPHNLFLDFKSALLRPAVSSVMRFSPIYLQEPVFSFLDENQTEILPTVQSVFLDFSTADYDATWNWNAEKNAFEREQNRATFDFEAPNLVIMEVPMWPIPEDEKGRLQAEETGSGEIILFQNGTRFPGTWRKESPSAALEFLDTQGNPLSFLPGKTWIAVFDTLEKIEVTPVVTTAPINESTSQETP